MVCLQWEQEGIIDVGWAPRSVVLAGPRTGLSDPWPTFTQRHTELTNIYIPYYHSGHLYSPIIAQASPAEPWTSRLQQSDWPITAEGLDGEITGGPWWPSFTPTKPNDHVNHHANLHISLVYFMDPKSLRYFTGSSPPPTHPLPDLPGFIPISTHLAEK